MIINVERLMANLYLSLSLSLILTSGLIKAEEKQDIYWQPPTPVFSQQFDWLKLNSGEWLKGDIISMYDDELEFESDEFDAVTFDWEDVEELRSRFDQQIRFDSGEVKQGFLIVKNKHLILISEGKENHYPLSQLLSITSSADDRTELWDGKFTLGIDISSGNTNQLDYSGNASIQRRTPFTRFNVDFIYNYSKSTQELAEKVISDTTRLTSYLDWFYSRTVFFRLLDYEYYADFQQNINSRSTIGLSAGYHLVDNKRLQWDVTLGPSFQKTIYLDTANSTDQYSGVIAVGTSLDYSLSSRIDYILDFQIQFVEKESGKRNSFLKTGIELDIKHDFELDIIFSIDRVAEPVASINTLPPESNDYKLIFSLGYDF